MGRFVFVSDVAAAERFHALQGDSEAICECDAARRCKFNYDI